VKPEPRPKLRQGQREDADLIVRLIDLSSHGGIGAHYRQLYGPEIDWRNKARLEIASGGEELGFQNAVLISLGASDAGGMILNPLRNIFIFTNPPDTRSGQVERLIAKAPGSLFIRELGVFPSFQGRGLGRALVDFAFDYAKSRGIDGVSLTVNADNLPAIGLYASSGFEETARAKVDGRDMLLMLARVPKG
jgi:ribosomal protein S18 acetylase RimI-like enzyme